MQHVSSSAAVHRFLLLPLSWITQPWGGKGNWIVVGEWVRVKKCSGWSSIADLKYMRWEILLLVLFITSKAEFWSLVRRFRVVLLSLWLFSKIRSRWFQQDVYKPKVKDIDLEENGDIEHPKATAPGINISGGKQPQFGNRVILGVQLLFSDAEWHEWMDVWDYVIC